MSTKATILASITDLESGIPNPASKVRDTNTLLLNELYPTIYRTTYNVPVKTSQLHFGFRYAFNFWKQGNTVHISGNFTTTTAIADGLNVMAFTDSEYDGVIDGVSGIAFQVFKIEGYEFRLDGATLSTVDSLPSGLDIFFNLSYITNP